MNAELHRRLTKLGLDLRAGHLDRAALFWLKIFADLVVVFAELAELEKSDKRMYIAFKEPTDFAITG